MNAQDGLKSNSRPDVIAHQKSRKLTDAHSQRAACCLGGGKSSQLLSLWSVICASIFRSANFLMASFYDPLHP
jgi:hypothetical protein